jgi:hypothetical protein
MRKLRRDLGDHRLDVPFAVDARLVQPAGDAPVLRRLEPAEREILELPLELPDAEPVGERGVDFPGFPGEVQPAGFVELTRVAHPAQLFREPYQHQPRVGDDREQHAPQRVGLVGGEAAARRPLGAGTKLAEPPELLREADRGLAGDRDGAGPRQLRMAEDRLQQRSRDDLAFRVERGQDGGRVRALPQGGRPGGVIRRASRSERGAQFLERRRSGSRCSGRRLHGEWLS